METTGPRTGDTRPSVVYVSYDGIGEPLGRSQVLGYLTRLAGRFSITLISFEKPDAPLDDLRDELRRSAIRWRPLRYHRRPPVLSTLLDVAAGVLELARVSRRSDVDIVHVRSYVPALIAVAASRFTGGRLLFDIRGFWADERVEGGIWPVGGVLYRVAKRCERRFFREADAVVTLTEASLPQIRAWTGSRDLPVEVIPTCVDLERFGFDVAETNQPRLTWSGSVGTWYRFDLAATIAAAAGLPLMVLTRQAELVREQLGTVSAEVLTLDPRDVPAQLRAGDVGLCLIKDSFSKTASAPTRLGEFLASGMPVIATPVGDIPRLLEGHGVGVVLRSEDPEAIKEATARALELAADPAVRERCRRLAEQRFDLAVGTERYADLYRRLIGVG